jgi:TetR/AcrR family acrAB operon transcriptional repressor
MRRTKAEAEETRAKLLEAAEALFFEHGPAAVGLERIAAAAGVTRGALYWHFTSKADILRALHDLVPMPGEELVALAIANRHADPLTLLQTIAMDCIRLIAADERRQRIYTILSRCDYRGEFLAVLEREREIAGRQQHLLVSLLQLAQELGMLHPAWQPACAARTCQCLFRGLLVEWLRDKQASDLVQDAGEVFRALFSTFRLPPAAAG